MRGAKILPPEERTDAARKRAIARQMRAFGVPADYARRRGLVRVREPARLVCIGEDIHGRMQRLTPRAARACVRMRAAAAADGVDLQYVSAFRSIGYQFGIFCGKLERGQPIEEILRVSAAPGYSEHHSGRALDLTTAGYAPLEEAFECSAAFAWLQLRAGAFGFTLSYPRGNPHGIAYEPWHWCWHARRVPARD
ncbi:MAG: M15 family metallopeptidase [Rhodanobacteraceae bacterium]